MDNTNRKMAEATITPHIQNRDVLLHKCNELNARLEEVQKLICELENIELTIEFSQPSE